MAVRIIKKSWWVDFRFDHTRYRKRSPENSRAGARAYEALLRHKLARGEAINAAESPEQTFEPFARKWFKEYVITNNKYSEQRTKKYILNASLIPFFGKMPVGRITAYHIEQYKTRRLRDGVTNKTIKNDLTVLSKCLSTAYEWLALQGTPPRIVWPKCTSYRTDYLSSEECDLLLSHADGVVYELILTALRTGMRQGELRGLQWSAIDWQNRMLAVRHSRCDYRKILVSPKSNRERYIPLDGELYQLLERRKKETGYVFIDTDGQPFDYKRLDRRLARVCRTARSRKVTWHILRHTFASQLAMKGVPLHVVQMLLGHASITTTMRYAHVAPSALRPAIDMLNPKRVANAEIGQPVGNSWLDTPRAEPAQTSVA
jgi:integrase